MSFRWSVVASFITASMAASALAAPIGMPAGSNVWMEWDASSSICPLEDGNDCAGSNQPGAAPPNGIPMTTIANAGGQFSTGFAEVLPGGQVRSFLRGNVTSFMRISVNDTFTVTGAAPGPGPFEIGVSLSVDGTVRSAPHPIAGNLLSAANVGAEIGTFFPGTDPSFNEQFRVNPFDLVNADKLASFAFQTGSVPFSHAFNITATYTKMVNVGDVFDLAFGVNSAFGWGEVDLLNTGVITFDLPEGVFLTSSLITAAIPAPGGMLGLLAGLGVMAACRQRRLRTG